MANYEFGHLHLVCSDVEATAKFLIDNFGARELSRMTFGAITLVIFQVGGQTLVLNAKGPADQIQGDMTQRRYGLDHWGLNVDDLDAACKDLAAKGVQFVVPPTTAGTNKYAFVLSPDGVQIELVERR